MTAEGVTFETGVWVGKDFDASDLLDDYDAICLTGGSTQARDLPVPGRELSGVHYAMEYHTQQNRLNSGQAVDPARRIEAEGKRVVILGGGDTGADCLGTAHRQGAEVVYQFEIMPEPPKDRAPTTTLGPNGPSFSGHPPPTRRAASATTTSRRRASPAPTATSSDCTAFASSPAHGRPSPSPTPTSSSKPTSSCSPWASCTPSTTGCSTSSA